MINNMNNKIYDQIGQFISHSSEHIKILGTDAHEFVNYLYDNYPNKTVISISSLDDIENFASMNKFVSDWTIITDEFDTPKYLDETQYNYMFRYIKQAFDQSKSGVIFAIREEWKDEFQYSILYIIARVFDTFPEQKVTVVNFGSGNNRYIFCINRGS